MEPLGTAPNIPLGIEAKFPYQQETCALAPGETLLLYSDGVYERQSRQGERLGPGSFSFLRQSRSGARHPAAEPRNVGRPPQCWCVLPIA